jgi:hypothetical protein
VKKLNLGRYLLFINLICFVLLLPSLIRADVRRVKYQAGGSYLVVEVLDDNLIHCELGRGPEPATDQALGNQMF